MFKIIVLVTFVYVSSIFGNLLKSEEKSGNARNKRLLFYDEEGNLVKTFTNPYLRDWQKPDNYPFFGPFLKPFQNFLQQPSNNFGDFTSYMIPVSDDVVQQINQDPMYQNKLIFSTPPREPTIEPNAMCNGKRTQIPSAQSCSNFLNCWDGWAFEQKCPPGLMFSEMGYCDYSHKVDCGNRRMSDSGTPNTQCRKDFEVFRNKAKCSEFFVCVNRLPVRFICPADLYYNEKLGICDYQYRVNCDVGLSVNPPASTNDPEPSPPNPATSTDDATVQTPPVTKIMYMDDIMDKMPGSGMSQVAMSRQDAIRMIQLQEAGRHQDHLINY